LISFPPSCLRGWLITGPALFLMVVYALICLLSLFLPGWVYSTNRDISVESGAIQSEARVLSGRVANLREEAARLQESITVQRGVTSYYSDWFDGRQMANGQIFHQDRRVIAHKSLPFGTAVFLVAGDHITFSTVQDRGPYIPGRTWDISSGMAQELGIEKQGVADVEAFILRSGK
jgi:rare lipoprotein A